jgi:UDP-N-acetylmuramyl pentapeptide phosphotransferase/UDP-N-acetylglucosamine-1-phosphate transferase
MYFFADATLTLMRRVIRGEQLWKAHREHFYQRAVTSGLRHDQVVWTIAIANIFLIMLAIVAARGLPQAAVLGAVGAVSMLVFLLAKGGPTDS